MKIGIVNDLTMALEALRRALAQRPEHTILWSATDGDEAVARCAENRPDLVLMDLLMPGMDGVEATRQIMARTPCAVLIVTASVKDNAPLVFEAVGHGAIDATDMPVLGDGADNAAPLLSKIDMIGRLIGDRPSKTAREPADRLPTANRLVAIGASAGGPPAVAKVLGALPATFPAAIVVIQHIDEQFTQGMADWLSRSSTWPVRLAQPGDRPTAGTVLLARAHEHLVVSADGCLGYTREPAELSYCPSVDVFFESINASWVGQAIGVLLTGMGRDGAAGLKALRLKGHHTIAQDQASSAVYGMPKAAAELGAAVDILPIEKIGPRLQDVFAVNSRSTPK
ncbi:MAG TPA: chemotaxis response regulator protein-glutamate methylesterase [Rhodanobacter sp.]|nr:chemotaxis response regulator protein-glutamate methylesterase [Rhodanobacter sp.]